MERSIGNRYRRGFTLIELLVAMLIISVGLIGMAGLTIESQKQAQQLTERTLALQLANDLLARMSANASALDQYSVAIPDTLATDCTETRCTPEEMAAYDLWVWNKQLQGANITKAGDKRLNMGGLSHPTACRDITDNGVTLTLVWRGKQPRPDQHTHKQCGKGNALYQQSAANDLRRILLIETKITS